MPWINSNIMWRVQKSKSIVIINPLAGQSHVLLAETTATDIAIEGGWGPVQDHRKQIFEKTGG